MQPNGGETLPPFANHIRCQDGKEISQIYIIERLGVVLEGVPRIFFFDCCAHIRSDIGHIAADGTTPTINAMPAAYRILRSHNAEVRPRTARAHEFIIHSAVVGQLAGHVRVAYLFAYHFLDGASVFEAVTAASAAVTSLNKGEQQLPQVQSTLCKILRFERRKSVETSPHDTDDDEDLKAAQLQGNQKQPAACSGDAQHLSPSGKPSPYRYLYLTGQRVQCGQRVHYEGKLHVIVRGNGGGDREDPCVFIRQPGPGQSRAKSVRVSRLTLVDVP